MRRPAVFLVLLLTGIVLGVAPAARCAVPKSSARRSTPEELLNRMNAAAKANDLRALFCLRDPSDLDALKTFFLELSCISIVVEFDLKEKPASD
jgi:hypothetical protein